MNRLTTDDPKGNFEMAMNFVYDKDGQAYIRSDGQTDNVPLWEYIDVLCEKNGCGNMIETPRDPEKTDWRCCDCAMDGDCCTISMMYIFASQAVQCRGVLKRYEDEPKRREYKCACGCSFWVDCDVSDCPNYCPFCGSGCFWRVGSVIPKMGCDYGDSKNVQALSG